jgi:sporulation protein YqfC
MSQWEKTSLQEHKVRKKEVPPMKRSGSWMERLAEGMDMNDTPMPGLPLVEVCGERRVLIENHRGVSRYGSEMICVRVSFGEVAVRGCNLELAKMTRGQLVILGRIDSVTMIRRGSR